MKKKIFIFVGATLLIISLSGCSYKFRNINSENQSVELEDVESPEDTPIDLIVNQSYEEEDKPQATIDKFERLNEILSSQPIDPIVNQSYEEEDKPQATIDKFERLNEILSSQLETHIEDPSIISRGLIFNLGIKSDQVEMLKDFFRLREKRDMSFGYYYNSELQEAVIAYQKEKGLINDGIIGEDTLESINREIRDKAMKIGLRIPRLNVGGELLIINKSSNTLYLIKDGIIQDIYPVATGKTIDLTPDGQFTIVVKYKNPDWGGAGRQEKIAGGDPRNPLGKRWIGISYGGGGLYGIHGNSNPRSIGSNASLGCVRMFNDDVEELYERVKINTPIWIGTESLLETYGVEFINRTS